MLAATLGPDPISSAPMPKPLALTLLLFASLLTGCSSLRGGGNALQIRSLESPATLTPAIRTACYKRIDDNTADLYFSDLPEGRLVDPSDDMADLAGSIVHIHFFLDPSPGNTPIDDTACNATLRHIIIAPATAPIAGGAEPGGGESPAQVFGIYGGGGFFYPSGSVGETTFGGTMHDAAHRLLYASPGFHDLLGPAAVNGRATATRDDAVADAIEARIEQYLQREARAEAAALPPPSTPTPPTKPSP